jgi:hypothetical protein
MSVFDGAALVVIFLLVIAVANEELALRPAGLRN